jgi:hypothetical protein
MRQMSISVLLLLVIGCGSDNSKQASTRDTLTQRQKDSIVANSRLPGAGAVKRAMTNADSTSAGIRRANAVATDTSQF